jgi:formate hydrogenlyase subunit 4
MSLLLSLLAQILHVALLVVAAPLAAGVTDWLQARLGGRSGPSVLLPWRDLVRLSRKTPMEMDSGSVVARMAPAVALGATVSAAALVPSFAVNMALWPLADMLVIVSLLMVARVTLVLGALDAGAARSGLAAQQSSALAVPAEAALVASVFALALMGGSFNLDLIISQARDGGLAPAVAAAVVLATLLALAAIDGDLADRGLDQSLAGTGLATARLACWLRRLVWLDLIGGLALPLSLGLAGAGPVDWGFGLLCWCVKLAAFVACLSGIQAMLGRMQPVRGPHLAAAAVLLAAVAAVLVLASARMA